MYPKRSNPNLKRAITEECKASTEDGHREKKYVLLLKEYDKKAKDLLFSQKKKYSVNLKHRSGKLNPTEVQKLSEKEQNYSYAISTDFISVKTERAQGKTLRPEKYLTGMTGDIVGYDIDLEDENGRIAYIGKLMTDSEKLIEADTLNQCSSSESFLNDHLKSQQSTYSESLQDNNKNKFEKLASEFDKTGSYFPTDKEGEKRSPKKTNIDEQEMTSGNLQELYVKAPKKVRRKGLKHNAVLKSKRMTEHEEKSSQNKIADRVGKELLNELQKACRDILKELEDLKQKMLDSNAVLRSKRMTENEEKSSQNETADKVGKVLQSDPLRIFQHILTELQDSKKKMQESKVACETILKLFKSPDSAVIHLKSIPEFGKSCLNEIVNKPQNVITVTQKKLTRMPEEMSDAEMEYNQKKVNLSLLRDALEYLCFIFLLLVFSMTKRNRIKHYQEEHSKLNDKADTHTLKSDDISLQKDELSVKEKLEELVTCIVDIERIPHTYITPQCAVTKSQPVVCRLKLLKQRPRICFKREDIEEALSEIINQSVRKGALRDASTIPPHVLDPTSHSFDLSKSDWCAYDTNTTQRRYVLPASGNELMNNLFTRLASFSDWPIDSPYSAVRLVEVGFLYEHSSSTIRCHCCGIQIDCRRQIQEFHRRNMTAIQMHTELNSDCEYVKNMEQLRREDNDLTDSAMSSVAGDSSNLHISQQIAANSGNQCNGQIIADSTHSESNNMSRIQQSVQRNTFASDNNIQFVSERHLLDNNQADSNSNGAVIPQHSMGSTQNAVMPELTHGENNPDNSRGNADEDEMNYVRSTNGGNETYAIKHPEFKTIISRLETYRSWQIPEVQDQRVLTEAGFYFTGSRDIVRCFCCDIGLAEWEDDDEPWVEHARHSPNCEYLKDKKGEDYINSIQSDWKKIYNPKHPEFNETQARLDSFAGWPRELSQRPDVLAAAGFFYTGENDVARCHYCDGGLREWEPHYDPWTEHARWFPFCKYLIKIKGLGYIKEVARINREEALVSVDDREENSSEYSTQQEEQDVIQQSFNDTPENRDDPLSTTAAQTLMCMGYTRHNVQYAINTFISQNGERNFRAEDLLEIVMDMEDRNEPFPTRSEARSGSGQNCQTQQDLEAENRRLKSEMMCITCKEKDRNMLFIPCGHRLFCEKCSSNVKRCPKCQKKVKKTVKILLA